MSKSAVSVSFHSQCGGQGFDPPLLHQNTPNFNLFTRSLEGLEFPNHQYVTKFFCPKLRLPFESVGRRVNQLLVIYMRSNLSATSLHGGNRLEVIKRRTSNAEVGGSNHRQSIFGLSH